MDFNNIYNTLSYDEQILGDKLGINNDINYYNNSHMQKNENIEKILQKIEEKNNTNIVCNCNGKKCNNVDNNVNNNVDNNVNNNVNNNVDNNVDNVLSTLVDNNTLWFIIVFLVSLCFIQYFEQINLINKIENMNRFSILYSSNLQRASNNKVQESNIPINTPNQ